MKTTNYGFKKPEQNDFYNADGSAHYDSGSYANTSVVLLIFTDEA